MNLVIRMLPLLLVILFLLFPETMDAQCSMCKASAEQSLKDGGTHALGINKGIFYLASFPYIIGMVLIFLWFKNKRNRQEQGIG